MIAQPKTSSNLVKTCYSYGLLSTVYTYDEEEITVIPELYKAFITYKRVTRGNLFLYQVLYSTSKDIVWRN